VHHQEGSVVTGVAQDHLHVGERGRAQRRLGEQHAAVGVRDQRRRPVVPIDGHRGHHGRRRRRGSRVGADGAEHHLVAPDVDRLADLDGRRRACPGGGASDPDQQHREPGMGQLGGPTPANHLTETGHQRAGSQRRQQHRERLAPSGHDEHHGYAGDGGRRQR
jgi:hypothetical protein